VARYLLVLVVGSYFLCLCRGSIYRIRRWDEGIVFGVARLEPRSKSASAGAKPGGFEAPVTIPSSLGNRGRDSFRSRSVRGMLGIRFAR